MAIEEVQQGLLERHTVLVDRSRDLNASIKEDVRSLARLWQLQVTRRLQYLLLFISVHPVVQKLKFWRAGSPTNEWISVYVSHAHCECASV